MVRSVCNRAATAARSAVLLLALALLVLPLSSTFARGAAEPEPERLTVITQWGGEDLEDLQWFLDIYTEETGIEMEAISAGEREFRVTMPLSFEAGEPPADVIFHPWMELHQGYAAAGHMMPLDELLELDQFSESFLDLISVEGTVYGVPLRVGLKPGFFYKRSFFARHGLEEPQTYPEFLELLDTLKEIDGLEAPIASGNGDGWPLTDVTEGFILGLGGTDLFNAIIDGDANFTDPELAEIMEEVARLVAEGYFSPARDWQSQVEELWDENYGLFWSHGVPRLAGFQHDHEEIGFFPFPGTSGITAAFNFMSVPVYTRNEEAARDFVRWVQSAEAQTRLAERRGELVGRLDVPNEAYPEHLRQQQVLLEDYTLLPDLDDIIGGEFLEAFRDQLKLLWSAPDRLADVLEDISDAAPASTGRQVR